VLARLALETSSYSPMDHLHRVAAPVLLVAAAYDTLCPPEVVRAAAEKLGGGTALDGGCLCARRCPALPGTLGARRGRPRREGARRQPPLAAAGPKAEVVEERCTHFDIYGNEAWERVVTRTLAFLDKHLSAGSPPTLTQ
jgi:hypothetical protein